MNDIVLIDRNGEHMVSSREVAAKFGKAHKNVLRSIDGLISEENHNDFMRLNFELHDFIDENGLQQREFFMTRDGFVLVSMGFTGKEALSWKIKFIAAFNSLTTTVESLNTRIQELESQLISIPQLPPAKKKRASPRIRVPVYEDVLPGFPQDPRIELKPESEVKDPERTIAKISRLRRIAKGIDATIDSLLTHVGL